MPSRHRRCANADDVLRLAAATQVLLEKDSDDEKVQALMMQMDGDGDGYVTMDEFKQWWLDTEDKAHHHYIHGAVTRCLV